MNNLQNNQKSDVTPMGYDTMLATVFSKCKEGTIVAFKDIEKQMWFTGYIQSIFAPNGKYNKTDKYSISIVLNVPIEPQSYDDDDKTVYYYDDICAVSILENGY